MVFDPHTHSTRLLTIPLVMAILALTLAGCGVSKQSQGVVNQWRNESLPPFERGTTTQSEVIERLGPPSQVIGLSDQTVFYLPQSSNEFVSLGSWAPAIDC